MFSPSFHHHPVHCTSSPSYVTMLKNNASTHQTAKPSAQAVRRAVASSTALETGQRVEQLEQKLQKGSQHRFAHIKLAT